MGTRLNIAHVILVIACLALSTLTTTHGKSSTLGKLDEFLEDNALAGTCSNGICTTSSGGEYSEVFENFVPEFFAGAKDMSGLMEAAKSVGDSGDMSAMAALAAKHQKESQKKLAPLVSQVYDQFVHPSSPGVDPETCRSMVREFLVACRRHMPLLARQSMDAGMKFGAMMAGGAGADGKMLEQMEQHMGDYLPQVSKTMAAVMEELQSRSDSMADEVFESMDANKDGVVDRREFDKSFSTAMQQVVNMQALAQTAQKVMEQISPADLEQLSKLLDPEQLKALSEMDPQDLLRQIQQMGAAAGRGGLGGLGGLGGMPGMPKGGRKGRLPPLGGKLK
eukprot:CAMPEP_0172187530 /NCGR_PEP_ID=MMETSP1050-20130122/21396_1 /TAXON_ID=233186 /ORGANISM="Cryptomonas curvata, Strain CCAP979/52" /LENGTH=335 /DNA_ID=CAMNT_0012861877 /DNA_START=8 /DNA_END=1015 /DNA_ORIENTATION=-